MQTLSLPAAPSEKHYTVDEVAAKLSVTKAMARKLFMDEPGVLAIGKPFSKYRRSYKTLRIPQSVFNRVYARLRNPAA